MAKESRPVVGARHERCGEADCFVGFVEFGRGNSGQRADSPQGAKGERASIIRTLCQEMQKL